MKNPAHPGEMLKELVLAPLNLTITEAASRLNIHRVSLSRVLNGEAGISPALARRLEAAGISTARFWLSAQMNYDLAKEAKRPKPKVRAFQDAA